MQNISRPNVYASTGKAVEFRWSDIMSHELPPEARKYIVIEKQAKTILSSLPWGPHCISQTEYIDVVPENKNFTSVDGVLFTKDMRILLSYPPKRKNTEYRIPDGVEIIECAAFYNAEKLEKIIMPDSVRYIERLAFYGCRNLNSLKLSENLERISIGAFQECLALTEITIPKSVRKIAYGALLDCENLKRVTVKSKKIDMKSKVISDLTSLESITLACSAEQLCYYATYALDESENFTEFSSPGVYIKLSKTDEKNEKNLESITLNGKVVEFKNTRVYNSMVPYIADTISSGSYGKYEIYTPPKAKVNSPAA